MTAHSGEPQVTPSRSPERNCGTSFSFRAVESGLFPGLRRSRKACSSARSMRSPAGRPSMVTPIAAPWDCPNTPTRSVLPNSEDIEATSQSFVFLPEGGIGFPHRLRACNGDRSRRGGRGGDAIRRADSAGRSLPPGRRGERSSAAVVVRRSLSFMRSRAALTKCVVPSRRAAITASGGSRSGQSDTSTLCSPAALNRS